MVPVQLPPMLLHGAVCEGTPESGRAVMQAGLEAELRARADRAKCLLCPIFQASHFTLLVLERWGEVEGEESASKPAESRNDRKGKQPVEEAKVFDQLSRPTLSWVSPWEVTYYDSILDESQPCRAVASRVLQALGIKDPLPPRKNKTRQRLDACGFWTLYWMEEHCRRQRGEPAWTEEYNLARRIDNLTKFKKHLEELQKGQPEEIQIE